MADDTLHDKVDLIKDTDSAILVIWDRTNGTYRMFFAGQALHLSSIKTLLKTMEEDAAQQTNSEGIICPPGEEDDDDYTPPWSN